MYYSVTVNSKFGASFKRRHDHTVYKQMYSFLTYKTIFIVLNVIKDSKQIYLGHCP